MNSSISPDKPSAACTVNAHFKMTVVASYYSATVIALLTLIRGFKMGVEFDAKCRCGYRGSASSGSTRAGHGKYFDFPHRCADCKEVVSVNILSGSIECPECNSKAVSIYGSQRTLAEEKRERRSPINWLYRLFGRSAVKTDDLEKASGRFKETPIHQQYCYQTATTYRLERMGHECPRCTTHSLFFVCRSYFD
jgi:Zn finger protein HypA/HybF involved in hydrogenase expression